MQNIHWMLFIISSTYILKSNIIYKVIFILLNINLLSKLMCFIKHYLMSLRHIIIIIYLSKKQFFRKQLYSLNVINDDVNFLLCYIQK